MRKITLLLCCVFLSQSVLAKQKPKEQSITSIINLYGVTFSHGSPPWLKKITDAKDILKASKYYKNQEGTHFIWEAIPADETFETWKTIYAVRALNTNQNSTITSWENSTLNVFKKTCEYPQINYLIMGIDASLVQVICPKIINNNKFGYSDQIGEVGIFAFMRMRLDNRTVLISHYTEWRGKKFDIAKRDEWPVNEKDLQTAIKELKKANASTDKSVLQFK